MENKRNNKLLIPFFIFIAILIVGLVGLFVSQQPRDYVFFNVKYSQHTGFDRYGFDGSFTIENKTQSHHENVQIDINYIVAHGFDELEYSQQVVADLYPGETVIQFVHNESSFGIFTLDEIEEVTITINGETYSVQNKATIGSSKAAFIICSVVGTIVGIALLASWLSSNKFKTHSSSYTNTIYSEPQLVQKKPEKYICQYCKCTFNTDKHHKCPNCGASIKSKN